MKKFHVLLLILLCCPAFAQESEAPQPPVTAKFGGFLITRYNYNDNASGDNTFGIRCARVIANGSIMDNFAYSLQLQMEGTTTSINGPHILDAYVEWQKYSSIRVKFGQFKRPFTIENHAHTIDQGFYSYGRAVYNLTGLSDRVGEHSCGGRDMGVQVQGDLFPVNGQPMLHYMLGVFNGQGINVADLNSRKDVIGTLWFTPVKGMRLGASGWSGSYGRRYEGKYAEVDRLRYAISGEYLTNDWTFRSEYVHNYGAAFKEAYGGNLDLDTDLGDEADAWYALAIAPIIPETLHVKVRYDVYRDNGNWNRAYNSYDFGVDYHFSKHLVVSAIGSFVNDRRLAAGSHNYCRFDLQAGFKF